MVMVVVGCSNAMGALGCGATVATVMEATGAVGDGAGWVSSPARGDEKVRGHAPSPTGHAHDTLDWRPVWPQGTRCGTGARNTGWGPVLIFRQSTRECYSHIEGKWNQ